MILACAFVLVTCTRDNSSTMSTSKEEHVSTRQEGIRGKILFAEKCVACHGADGTAGIANAANLQISEIDSASVSQIIRDGKAGMPGFKDIMTPEEIRELMVYVRSLRK